AWSWPHPLGASCSGNQPQGRLCLCVCSPPVRLLSARPGELLVPRPYHAISRPLQSRSTSSHYWYELLRPPTFMAAGAGHAQDTNAFTAPCGAGTTFSGTKRSGACRGHGGVQSWGAAAAPSQAAPSQPTATTAGKTAAAPGGGRGQVGVNTASNVYHCP